MKVLTQLATKHDEIVHDVSYDFYGKRLATCSSDGSIKIWDKDDGGEWKATEIKSAHNASIWKVKWAYPEYGQVIASCSSDRTVCIREETLAADGERKWVKKATLVDSRDTVTDIAFAPRHFGLRLATCSSDGVVRIYEAIDVTNLAHWPLMEEFEVHKGANHISWNPSASHSQMLAVGGEDPEIKIYLYDTNKRRWESMLSLPHNSIVHDVAWAPNLGRSYHLIAAALKHSNIGVKIWKLDIDDTKTKFKITQAIEIADHRAEVWRVEWNITGTILSSSGDDGTIRLWKADISGRWKNIATATTFGEDSSSVY